LGANISSATSVYFNTFDDGNNATVGAGDVFVDHDSVTSGITLPNPNDPALGAYQLGGFGTTWNMTVEYLLYGTVIEVGADLAGYIAGGYFNFYYNDLTNANGLVDTDGGGNPIPYSTTQVLSLEVTGSVAGSVDSLGANVTSVADYGFLSDLSAPDQLFAQEFFNIYSDAGGYIDSLFNKYTDGQANAPEEIEIPFLTVTTLNGQNLPGIEEVAYGAPGTLEAAGLDLDDLTPAQLEHYTSLFGADITNIPFASGSRTGEELSSNTQLVVVPEPTSLAIFGLGLLGLAGAARRKNS